MRNIQTIHKIVWTDGFIITVFKYSCLRHLISNELQVLRSYLHRPHRILVILGRLGPMASLTVNSRGVVVVRWRLVNRTIRLRL